MSIGAPAFSQLNGYQGVAPDSDVEVICPGAARLSVQIYNSPVYITFGIGQHGAVRYDARPEFYAPIVGQISRRFDAFKLHAATPAAQLPAGQQQAYVSLNPR